MFPCHQLYSHVCEGFVIIVSCVLPLTVSCLASIMGGSIIHAGQKGGQDGYLLFHAHVPEKKTNHALQKWPYLPYFWSNFSNKRLELKHSSCSYHLSYSQNMSNSKFYTRRLQFFKMETCTPMPRYTQFLCLPVLESDVYILPDVQIKNETHLYITHKPETLEKPFWE